MCVEREGCVGGVIRKRKREERLKNNDINSFPLKRFLFTFLSLSLFLSLFFSLSLSLFLSFSLFLSLSFSPAL